MGFDFGRLGPGEGGLPGLFAGAAPLINEQYANERKSKLELMMKSRQIEMEMQAKQDYDMANGVDANAAAWVQKRAGYDTPDGRPLSGTQFNAWSALAKSEQANEAKLKASQSLASGKSLRGKFVNEQLIGEKMFEDDEIVPMAVVREARMAANSRAGGEGPRKEYLGLKESKLLMEKLNQQYARVISKGPLTGRAAEAMNVILRGESFPGLEDMPELYVYKRLIDAMAPTFAKGFGESGRLTNEDIERAKQAIASLSMGKISAARLQEEVRDIFDSRMLAIKRMNPNVNRWEKEPSTEDSASQKKSTRERFLSRRAAQSAVEAAE